MMQSEMLVRGTGMLAGYHHGILANKAERKKRKILKVRKIEKKILESQNLQNL